MAFSSVLGPELSRVSLSGLGFGGVCSTVVSGHLAVLFGDAGFSMAFAALTDYQAASRLGSESTLQPNSTGRRGFFQIISLNP